MSRAEVSTLIAIVVILPFAGSLAVAVLGGAARSRKVISAVYAMLAAGFNLALLSGYLQHPARAGWGSIKLSAFSYPVFLVLNLLTVAAMLYAGFRSSRVERPGLLLAAIPAACGLGALAVVVTTLLPFVLLWLGVTVVALLGLLAHGGAGLRGRLRAFTPWLVSDLLLVAGAILCATWLKESSILIKPPALGNETQTVIVVALFLASALIRLGVFPLQAWIRDLTARTDPSWSSFFLGSVNFLLAGFRLVIAMTLLGRLVASDWGLGLAIFALFSVVLGPVLALRSSSAAACASDFYCMQSGFLLLALALFSRPGLEAGLFIALTAPLALTAFMMATGTAGDLRGTGLLGQQRLPVRLAPAAFAVALTAGLALAGAPPFDGFIGKAFTALAGIDKSGTQRFYILAAAACLAAIAVALVASGRLLAGSYAAQAPQGGARRPALLEGLTPVGICVVSLMLGAFPGLLVRNFLQSASRSLFAPGFTGPAVAFKGAGAAVTGAMASYDAWGAVVAAALLAVAGIAAAAYFISRARHPSAGGAVRRAPFLGGAQGEHSMSWPVLLSWFAVSGGRGRRRR